MDLAILLLLFSECSLAIVDLDCLFAAFLGRLTFESSASDSGSAMEAKLLDDLPARDLTEDLCSGCFFVGAFLLSAGFLVLLTFWFLALLADGANPSSA